ncbi:MAG: hypothetical protein V3W31_03795, partial [Thermodesulfobacteriota bacterium]
MDKKFTGMAVNGEGGGLVLVQAERTGLKWAVKKMAASGLDGGFREAVREAAGPSGIRPDAISLSIPDTLAKTAILDFESLPAKTSEADRVIRWKAASTMYLRPEECAIDYQLLSTGERVKVLAIAVKREIITGYEDALTGAGFTVRRVGIHSLNILNLFSEYIKGVEDFSFITCEGGRFSVLIFKGGALDFYRAKDITGREQELGRELAASFTFYLSAHKNVHMDRVYFLSGDTGLGEFLADAAGTEAERLKPETVLTVE